MEQARKALKGKGFSVYFPGLFPLNPCFTKLTYLTESPATPKSQSKREGKKRAHPPQVSDTLTQGNLTAYLLDN